MMAMVLSAEMQLSSVPFLRKKIDYARGDPLCLRLYSSKRKEGYSTYIYKVLKQMHQVSGVSCWVADVINSLDKPQLFGKVALEAARLSLYNKRSLITCREVQAAMKLVLLHELSKQDRCETIKAVTKSTGCQ
ncbi:histone H2B-like isoform X1 [Mauremys mutica]|uniref:histone H2B-like isoform X1 n=1 Tax=Mauremys mutica TaxID=74926 RepID=UPI001D16F308|nr:histone H2B-like isoform X1 [Mauremys mutica]